MSKKGRRYTEEQIIAILKDAEAATSAGGGQCPEAFRARPATPAARMSAGSGSFLITLSSTSAIRKIVIVGKSMIARRPSTNAAPAIAPHAAAVTPLTNALADRFSA